MHPVTSIYIWGDAVHEASEARALLRSRLDLLDDLAAYVVERHPYKVPNVTAVPIVGGNPDYLAWIHTETAGHELKEPDIPPTKPPAVTREGRAASDNSTPASLAVHAPPDPTTLPEFQSLMRPLLALLTDGQPRRSREIRAGLANQFRLSERELSERLPKGQNRFTNLVAWALHHLSRARLVERRGPSNYRITDRGRQVLIDHPTSVDITVCGQFDEYHHSRVRRSARR
jgi:hypothetical protein